MSTIASRIVIPDVFDALPARCRRGGGRAHEPYWTTATPEIGEAEFRSAAFGARSIEPKTIVNFGRKRLTFSYLSAKTGTGQQGEGPWEYLLAKYLEGEPTIVKYQFHGIETVWTNGGTVLRSYGPDATWVDTNGTITCAEVKASDGYFAEPDTHVLCNAAEEGLASIDVSFARITGDALQADRRRAYNVATVFADRLTSVSEKQVDLARDRLAGGDVALGRLGEILGARPSTALQTINALMVGRHLAYDLSEPATPDMRISAAPAILRATDIHSIGA
ncbi:hypothetical protein [Sphingomonas sp. CFBP 13706]|uniref:hypothetical protein n=1 Tax=Sphingomonas sp. CFBP 13706 TaxID=2775314 RepID=UPI001785AF20|nr:hypothetical protein [Sphingomonas sp. CFBP 13706]MBD8736235.1 hypothetical protein [Sphingomonas sp. CFBP 13706]